MALCRTLIRVGVIGALATGALAVVAGPERVSALAGQARSKVISQIDNSIEDPVLLRAQLRDLEAKFPARIAEVRGDVVELQSQMAELHRDKAVAEKVVEMARADLAELKDMLTRAEDARRDAPAAIIQVRFDQRPYTLDQAYSRATQINNTLNAYASRVADADRDIAFLAEQGQRLEELLAQLETERAQFQAQVWQLDGQVEMIARNDRLIEIIEKRQKSLERYEKFDAVSLDQITQRMARIRAEQEGKLQSLASSGKTQNYEQKAKAMIDAETAARTVFEKSVELTPVRPTVLEISPGNAPAHPTGPTGPVAMSKPIVID